MTDIKQKFFERFLRELFHRRGEGFVLKGGAAMQARFDPHRMTKDVDLDFTNPKRTADSLHNSIERAIASAARSTAVHDLQLTRPGKGELTPRWKINFTDDSGERHHLEVEVSRAAARAAPTIPVQLRYTPRAAIGTSPFWVDTYDTPALIATKLAALLGRAVPAPRDVFDLDKLCASAAPLDAELVDWALARANVDAEGALTLAHDRLGAMGWAQFQSELLDALPVGEAERMNADEWSAMKHRVADYLAQVLR